MAVLAQLSSSAGWSAVWSSWGAAVAIFAMASLAFFLVARLFVRNSAAEDARLGRDSADELGGERNGGVFGRLTTPLAAQLPESAKERGDFERLLRQAGIYSPGASATIYALRFVLLVVPLLVAGIWAVLADSRQTVFILIGGAIVAAVLAIVPRMYVFLRRRRRMRRIREGLPDTLDMLSMCVSGGLELGESLDHVARRLTNYPECAQELLLLKRQAELGGLKHALRDFANRVDLPETNQLAALLLRGSSLGTQLVGSLTEQADHMRVARRQWATAQANKTPFKMIFPVLFCFAPAALILLMAPAVMQLRDYLRTGPSGVQALQSLGSRANARAAAPSAAGIDRNSRRDILRGVDRTRQGPAGGTPVVSPPPPAAP